MQELETLLTSLVQRGWKPAGFPGESEIKISEDWDVVLYMDTDDATVVVKVKLRNLVSLESGLWQFVCENWLRKDQTSTSYWSRREWGEKEKMCRENQFEYRLLESAMIPEEELGKFLVDNIKIQW